MRSERAFVIGYDIANPRRLYRVHRAMIKHATPIEYSVFVLTGSERVKDACLARIAPLLKPDEDDVRCYPLPERGFQGRIGRVSLPEGIQWTGLPAGLA